MRGENEMKCVLTFSSYVNNEEVSVHTEATLGQDHPAACIIIAFTHTSLRHCKVYFLITFIFKKQTLFCLLWVMFSSLPRGLVWHQVNCGNSHHVVWSFSLLYR